jgi:hypothetical protein
MRKSSYRTDTDFPCQKNRKRKPGAKEESSSVDREVLDVIQEEKRKGSRRRPKDVAEERKKRRLAEDGLRAIKANDARTFTALLRQAGISENSSEWKAAWKAFYSD